MDGLVLLKCDFHFTGGEHIRRNLVVGRTSEEETRQNGPHCGNGLKRTLWFSVSKLVHLLFDALLFAFELFCAILCLSPTFLFNLFRFTFAISSRFASPPCCFRLSLLCCLRCVIAVLLLSSLFKGGKLSDKDWSSNQNSRGVETVVGWRLGSRNSSETGQVRSYVHDDGFVYIFFCVWVSSSLPSLWHYNLHENTFCSLNLAVSARFSRWLHYLLIIFSHARNDLLFERFLLFLFL